MNECPECKGKKGYERQVSEYWEPEENYCSEWVKCRTCTGKGEIGDLALAVYKARGGSAPVPFRGYA